MERDHRGPPKKGPACNQVCKEKKPKKLYLDRVTSHTVCCSPASRLPARLILQTFSSDGTPLPQTLCQQATNGSGEMPVDAEKYFAGTQSSI